MLTAAHIIPWLSPTGVQAFSADDVGQVIGEYILIDLATPGAGTGGEGQFRKANFNLTVYAKSADALSGYQQQVEGLIVADQTGYGVWPITDGSLRVFTVDYAVTGNAWQRRAVDSAERHIAVAQFVAQYALNQLV